MSKKSGMRYCENILGTIGNTPLVKLHTLTKKILPLVLVKMESFNPGGSIKDRIGVSMIEEAEKKGLLKPGGTIIEPTSGNTGVGLALVANLKGYKTIFVMPDKMSMDKENLLKAYGAKVVRTPTNVEPDDPRSYYMVAKRLVEETPHSFSPNQYFNKANPVSHFNSTGPEIWNDTEGSVTHFVAGMGTGGTISGVGHYLKRKSKKVKVIGIDTIGSLYHGRFYGKKETVHSYKIEGIGEDFMPGTMDIRIIDDVIPVSDKQAYAMTQRLALEEGILVGSSSGAAVYGALKVAKNLKKSDVMVIILPDTGRNYLSTAFNPEWVKKNIA